MAGTNVFQDKVSKNAQDQVMGALPKPLCAQKASGMAESAPSVPIA